MNENFFVGMVVGVLLGQALILFGSWLERRRTKDAPDLGESSASDSEPKPAPSG